MFDPCQFKRCRFDPWVRKIPWSRRKWQSTPIFSPGKFHRQKSPWGHRIRHKWAIEQAHTRCFLHTVKNVALVVVVVIAVIIKNQMAAIERRGAGMLSGWKEPSKIMRSEMWMHHDGFHLFEIRPPCSFQCLFISRQRVSTFMVTVHHFLWTHWEQYSFKLLAFFPPSLWYLLTLSLNTKTPCHSWGGHEVLLLVIPRELKTDLIYLFFFLLL